MADGICDDEIQTGPPHEALFLTLTYLPLLELLKMRETCISLRDAVDDDTLPWIHFAVNYPLSHRISDGIMMRYASKANGRMKSLVLNKCVKVTDNGLLQVVEQNPFIAELHVPGCTGLTPDGVVTAVKTISKDNHNFLTGLKVSGIYNISQEHLQALRSILTDNLKWRRFSNPFASSFKHEDEGESPIDVDICPTCDQVRLVFKCSDENCKRKQNRGVKECRGCCYCIPRCVECGKCVDEEDEVDAACEDTLCCGCWLKLPKCSLCNRPYCKDHVHLWYVHEGGFVCGGCIEKLTWHSCD